MPTSRAASATAGRWSLRSTSTRRFAAPWCRTSSTSPPRLAPLMASWTFYEAVPGLLDALPVEVQTKYRRQSGHAPSERSLAIVRQALREWRFDRDTVRLAVAPTIPAHCSDDMLTGAAALAREFEAGFQTHLAESKIQAVAGLKHYGKTLTAHLASLGGRG